MDTQSLSPAGIMLCVFVGGALGFLLGWVAGQIRQNVAALRRYDRRDVSDEH